MPHQSRKGRPQWERAELSKRVGLLNNGLALKLSQARAANLLSLEFNDVFLTAAKAAGGAILSKNYLVAFNEDLNGIRVIDIHFLAHFLWYNYTTELINVSNNTGRFHFLFACAFLFLMYYVNVQKNNTRYILAHISFNVKAEFSNRTRAALRLTSGC